jgi:hypothetical protein
MPKYEIVPTGQGKGFVTNTKTGRKFSHSPIPLANAEKQLRLISAPNTVNFRGRGEK